MFVRIPKAIDVEENTVISISEAKSLEDWEIEEAAKALAYVLRKSLGWKLRERLCFHLQELAKLKNDEMEPFRKVAEKYKV